MGDAKSTDMRKDIIKGIRWALIFSVVAIASIGVDRMIRSTPALAKPAADLPAVAVPTHEPEAAVPEPPAPKSATPPPHASSSVRPVPVAVRLDPVPLPPSLPPLADTADFARPAPPKVIAAVRTQETRAIETPTALVAAPEPVPERVTNYVE